MRPKPRLYKGLRDIFSADALLKQRMIDTVRGVYESYGYGPLETPAFEFVDVLGKHLPESTTPSGGIFAFRNPDLSDASKPSPDDWLALRYDLTAPLARVFSRTSQGPSAAIRSAPCGATRSPGRVVSESSRSLISMPSVSRA